MSTKQAILQIKQNNKVLLSAIDIEEELEPLNKINLVRNLENELIEPTLPRIKYKYSVKSNCLPEVSLLQIGASFEILPTIRFKEIKTAKEKMRKVPDSVEQEGKYVSFRPIFQMVLKNYSITNGKNFKYLLEFEEA